MPLQIVDDPHYRAYNSKEKSRTAEAIGELIRIKAEEVKLKQAKMLSNQVIALTNDKWPRVRSIYHHHYLLLCTKLLTIYYLFAYCTDASCSLDRSRLGITVYELWLWLLHRYSSSEKHSDCSFKHWVFKILK